MEFDAKYDKLPLSQRHTFGFLKLFNHTNLLNHYLNLN